MEWLIGVVILAWLMRGKRPKRNRTSTGRSYKPAKASYVNTLQKKEKIERSKRQTVLGGAGKIELLGLSDKRVVKNKLYGRYKCFRRSNLMSRISASTKLYSALFMMASIGIMKVSFSKLGAMLDYGMLKSNVLIGRHGP